MKNKQEEFFAYGYNFKAGKEGGEQIKIFTFGS